MHRRCTEILRAAESAAEDLDERRFRHGLVRNALGLGAFAEDRPVEDRRTELQNELVLACRDLLLP